MPEIAEVARAVHYLHKHLVGKTLKKVTAVEDQNVFGKVGTSHTEIMKRLTGKKVIDAGQQGKYFWMIMSSPPHPVIHFGMSGWVKFRSEHTYYYKKEDGPVEDWPPRYWKVTFETDGEGDDKTEAAFVDGRRFGRFRLVDCPGKEIRQYSPLVENGPDPVQDKDKVTVEWLKDLCQRKKVPIKAMLLDQANISGIGNWVGDEIMYNAKMHPEQYANTLSDAEIKTLHKNIHYVCTTAVDLLADSSQFPETWLFKHRWGKDKGKKDSTRTLPNGEKLIFLTVGGRTSAVVPSVQKKTGPVAKEISDAEEDEVPKKTKKGQKSKAQKEEDSDADEETVQPAKKKASKRVKEEDDADEDEKPLPKKRAGQKTNGQTTGSVGAEASKTSRKSGPKTTDAKSKIARDVSKAVKVEDKEDAVNGNKRRSGRLRK